MVAITSYSILNSNISNTVLFTTSKIYFWTPLLKSSTLFTQFSLLKSFFSKSGQLAQDKVILKFIGHPFLMLDCFAQSEYRGRCLFLRHFDMPCSSGAHGRPAPFLVNMKGGGELKGKNITEGERNRKVEEGQGKEKRKGVRSNDEL